MLFIRAKIEATFIFASIRGMRSGLKGDFGGVYFSNRFIIIIFALYLYIRLAALKLHFGMRWKRCNV